MSIDPRRVKALFQSALDLEGPDRAAFLDRECGDDSELRRRLDDLLGAFEHPASALDRPLVADPEAETLAASGMGVSGRSEAATAAIGDGGRALEATATLRRDDPDPALGAVIAGRYKLRQAIGEGGMGSVYLAEQTQPVKRQVALKLIKPGMDSRTVLARFESERQALAMMDHPHIAKVLDAGTTEQGRPFFVMELVKGIPLTEFCDRHQLDLPARLALFRQICSAVQHAHQKGIIHRDLKPTNILVESHDGKPVPKVIDFGLAKATSGMQLSEHSLFTAFGSVTGTPLYMAPEQATFNALDVDTRADIYALGVILYELLTGSTPIQRDTMRRAALDEMLRVIREVEPPTPSSRISTSEGLPSLAANRHVEPARLSRLVRGDLDWIVMKALAKERERRYDSAIGMANDVERFLNHEPVSAGPPTAAYRMRKFVRRHRGRVAAAALVLLALLAGVAGTTLGLFEARRQEARANERAEGERLAKQKALEAAEGERLAKQKAVAAAEKEKKAKETAEAVLGFVENKVFAAARPKGQAGGLGYDVKLADAVTAALPSIEDGFQGKPLTEARLRRTIGISFYYLGKPELAAGQFEAARTLYSRHLGPDHPDTLASMNSLANSYADLGRRAEALKLGEETLSLRKAKLGPDHPDTLASMTNLAVSYAALGRHAEALKLCEETLSLKKARLGPDHPDTLASMTNLANSYAALGRRAEALKLREETLSLKKAKLGPDHPDTLASMTNLANSYAALGRRAEALKLREETLSLKKAKLGPDHPDTLASMNSLAQILQDAGQFDRAEALWDELVATRRKALGDDHADTLAARLDRADLDLVRMRYDAAEPAYLDILAECRARLGPNHANTAWAERSLVILYQDRGDWSKLVPLYWTALERARKAPGNRVALGSALATLGRALLEAKQWAEAEPICREALEIREADAPDLWSTFNTRSMLGGSLLGQGKTAEAEPLLRSGYEGMKARAGKIPPIGKPRLAEALDRLITFGEATGKTDEVKAWKAERAKMDSAGAATKSGSEGK